MTLKVAFTFPSVVYSAKCSTDFLLIKSFVSKKILALRLHTTSTLRQATSQYCEVSCYVITVVRRRLLGMVMCTCTYNSYNLPEGLFGSYVARLGTKF